MGGKLFTDKLVFGWLEGFGAWSLDSAPQFPALTPPTLVAYSLARALSAFCCLLPAAERLQVQ